jgi:hypothetical protein
MVNTTTLVVPYVMIDGVVTQLTLDADAFCNLWARRKDGRQSSSCQEGDYSSGIFLSVPKDNYYMIEESLAGGGAQTPKYL